jgi:protein-L-isoaspartate(D-aspartate) O-methyltransferase
VLANEDLLRTLLSAGIRDERVLDAFRVVPRHELVPQGQRSRAYEDVPLPIGHGQVTTQPSLIAQMLQALALRGSERVLEVGTGHGFQTALLARLAREVWSIERRPDLAATARASLRRVGAENTHVILGDGSKGLPQAAPFDAIVVAAAFTRVPAPLEEQLARGGRLVQPIGPGGREDVALFVKQGTGLRREALVTAAHFVRLIGEHAFAEDGD